MVRFSRSRLGKSLLAGISLLAVSLGFYGLVVGSIWIEDHHPSDDPGAQKWLWPLLEDADESVVLAAIRGLAMIGGDKVSSGLTGVLANLEKPEKVRIEAAVALGRIGSDLSQSALLDAFARVSSEDLTTEILRGLGESDFNRISPVFSSYLADPSTTPEMRVVAVEALAHSSSDAIGFLMEKAAADADSDVRASAAWAISAHQSVNHLGGPLAEMAVAEPEPDVRRRLYEAMLCQAQVPADSILPTLMAEEDAAARIAGFNVLGNLARQQPSSGAREIFDRQVATELRELATGENSLNLQMRAVFALRRAGTPAAMQALAAIEAAGTEQISTAARNGLRASHP